MENGKLYMYIYIIYIHIYNIYTYIYINLPDNIIVRLPHPRSGHSQGQETFLAPSADKQTSNYTQSDQTTIPLYQY